MSYMYSQCYDARPSVNINTRTVLQMVTRKQIWQRTMKGAVMGPKDNLPVGIDHPAPY